MARPGDTGHRDSLDLQEADDSIPSLDSEAETLLNNPAHESFRSRLQAARRAQSNARNLEKSLKDYQSGKTSKRDTLYEADPDGSQTPPSEGSIGFDGKEEATSFTVPKKPSKKRQFLNFSVINILVVALFLAIAYGAYLASRYRHKSYQSNELLSNGTSNFAPTTVLISLDGFRADFLQRGLTPYLKAMQLNGISARYMTPSFPSVTFPNHYTMVTGLYPQDHGIVGNSFWDPELGESFYYTDTKHSMQAKWWSAVEPIWVTAEEQGISTAIHMWPGSEAHIGSIEPTDVDKYNGTEELSRKVDRILGLLDRPSLFDDAAAGQDDFRPQLIAAYVPNVDADGHLFGPNSTEVGTTIVAVDRMIGDLFGGLKSRNLTDVVNVIVVSDHGMATTSTNRLIQLEDLLDLNLIESRFDGWPSYGLWPKPSTGLQELYQTLHRKSQDSAGFDVYLGDQTPREYHFSSVNSKRIAPLWLFPRTGWAIVTRDEYDVAAMKSNGDVYHPRGIHGYNNSHPLMRAIFVASGPAFPHEPGTRLREFANVNVYNIVCGSIGISARPNNGTLRLPLHGMEDDPTRPDEEPVQDFAPAHPTVSPLQSAPIPESTSQTGQYASDDQDQTTGVPERPVIDDDSAAGDDDGSGSNKSAINKFLDWLHDQIDGISDWVEGNNRHTGDDDTMK